MRLLILASICVVFFSLTSCKKKDKPVEQDENLQVNYISSPAAAQSSLPFLFSNGNKTLLSWVEEQSDTLTIFKYSQWEADKWQQPQEILRGSDWFVNWADFPMIAENKENFWSHILKKSASDTYAYDVKFNIKPKGSDLWKTNLPLHSDGTTTEHGFVSVVPYKDAFFIAWLDGRNTLENKVGERGAMTIRTAEVDAHGTITAENELDNAICDCCQTTAAITANGPVVLYRDRSPDEIRDISIVRKVAGDWTQPKKIYEDQWMIKGCPVNGPKVSAINNNLVVAWFTAAQENPRVQLIFSTDGGANFDAPIQVTEGKVIGRVDVVLMDPETALVSWMETVANSTQLNAMRISRKGHTSTKHIITTLDASRKTGFPQMEKVGNSILFAWTDVTTAESLIKTALVAVDQL